MKKNKLLLVYIVPALLWTILSIWAFYMQSSSSPSERLTLIDLVVGDAAFIMIWSLLVYGITFLISKIKTINFTDKQENIIILLQFILCLLCFLSNWFKWNILSSFLWVFGNITICFILLSAVFILYIISFIKLRYFKLIVTIFMFFITIFLSFHDFTMTKIKLEFKLFYADRTKIVKNIIDKKYTVNTEKLKSHYSVNYNIPLRYRYTSVSGQTLIYNLGSKENVIAFYILRAPLTGPVEIVYSDGGKKAITKYKDLRKIKSIKVLKNGWFLVNRSE